MPNTLRLTHPLTAYPAGVAKPEIGIFGDSITYGWSVNDEETYRRLLQTGFADYEIVNFGADSYGTLRSLIHFLYAPIF